MESNVSYEQRPLQNSDLFYTDDLNKMQKNAAQRDLYITQIAESMMTEQLTVF